MARWCWSIAGWPGPLGSGFDIDETGGLLVVDIGGSKTEISLVSMGDW